MSKTGET